MFVTKPMTISGLFVPTERPDSSTLSYGNVRRIRRLSPTAWKFYRRRRPLHRVDARWMGQRRYRAHLIQLIPMRSCGCR
jgi:hypothetical protein